MRYRALWLVVTLVSLAFAAGCSKQEKSSNSAKDSPAAKTTAADSGSHIELRFDPTPPVGGIEHKVYVRLADTAGKPIPDADVKLILLMPAMPSMDMPEMRVSKDMKWNGREYAGTINISMAGGWKATVEATKGGRQIANYKADITAK
jgi:hypothetical protein